MIREGMRSCPICGNMLKYYDSVYRIVKEGDKKSKKVLLYRWKCCECNRIHREIPDYILPFKHYSLDVIYGVIEGFIDINTHGFMDYPCELTMHRWIKLNVLYRRGQ